MSGTSMATPFVSGPVEQLLELAPDSGSSEVLYPKSIADATTDYFLILVSPRACCPAVMYAL